jgi:HK97 gp10 family phage protein
MFRKIGDVGSAAERKLDRALNEIALLAEGEIKNRTPVVTGRLKSSMAAHDDGLLKKSVVTNVEYAPYVEFGTRSSSPRSMMRSGVRAADEKAEPILRRHLAKPQ